MISNITISGADQVMAYLARVQDRLANDQKTGLVRSVNRIADVWLDNFRTEGQRVGRWTELADATQLKRASLGFNPSHPILERSSALRNVTIDAFASARGSATRSRGDNYSGNVTQSTLRVDNGVAKLSAHGWKIVNQYEAASHRARPIWFVDQTVLFAAQSGLVDWIVNDVLPV